MERKCTILGTSTSRGGYKLPKHAGPNQFRQIALNLPRCITSGKEHAKLDIERQREFGHVRARHEEPLAVGEHAFRVKRSVIAALVRRERAGLT